VLLIVEVSVWRDVKVVGVGDVVGGFCEVVADEVSCGPFP
jgi:hypothetical protein